MDAVRKIYKNLPDTIKTPNGLKNRHVEVIMLPLDDNEVTKADHGGKRANPIEEFIGAWEGEPLVRPDQGEYEEREPLT
jgi:hypothetical protein